MLSSQISALSHNSKSSLLQTSVSSSTPMFRSTGSLPRRPRPSHQIRTMRLSLSFEPKVQKEALRVRNRAIKHKYIEAINKSLAWDRQHPGFARQFGFKGLMCSAWRGQDSRTEDRWAYANEFNSEKSDPQRNNDSGIEDVELGAFDKLWGKEGLYELLRARSRAFRHDLDDLNSAIFSSHTFREDHNPGVTSASSNIHQASETKASHTERKTRLSVNNEPEYGTDPITNKKLFKLHPRHTNKTPIDVPVKTFKGYRSQFTEFEPPKFESPKQSSNSESITSQAVQFTKSDSPRECLQDYEGSGTYKPYFAYEPDGEIPGEKKPDPVQAGLKDFDRNHSYRWSSWFNAPEKSTSEEHVKSCPVQEGLKDYDSRTTYEVCSRDEPKIKVPDHIHHSDVVQEGLKDFDSVACYGILRSSTEGESDKIAAEDKDPDWGLSDFDARSSYGPVMHNEPDGQPPIKPDAIADGLQDFDSKVDYGRRRILKNISLNRGHPKNDKSFRYLDDIDTREDLDLLRPSDIRAASGIIKEARKESETQKLAKRQELEEDFKKPQQSETNADEISVESKGTDTQRFAEAESTQHTTRKLTGNFVRDFPEEFNTSWTASRDASGTLSPKKATDKWVYDKVPKGLKVSYQQEIENNVEKAEKEFIDGRAAKESFARNPATPRLQTSLDRKTYQEPEVQPVDKFEVDSDPYSKTTQGLETNYADECKILSGADPYSKEPQGLETNYAEECAANQGEGDHSASVSSYGSESQVAKTTREKALVRELQRIYEDKYGAIDLIHRQSPDAPTVEQHQQVKSAEAAPEVHEPTGYKILAYDPTMQSISIAETISIVPDSASALTPAEVLLRLSNPAKFFPHFQPLQSEGYEIVSGSGDVLVFRKVRAAGPPGPKSESSHSYQDQTRKTMNPIDGMQSRPVAATGNFASPTGFVNYDRPLTSDPPFKSNIDVRREEPVFSGKSAWSEGAEKTNRKKPSLAKRVFVGSAMVGGCSYAIGVVAEYFKSGGADGLGPQTF